MVAGNTTHWQQVEVTGVGDIADRIRRIELHCELPTRVRAGEHLDVRIPTADGLLERSYSIVDASADGTTVALSVLHTRDSRGGSAAMHALKPGDCFEASTPIQDFPLRVGAPQYVLLAGGIGITAISSIADALRRVDAEYRIVYVGRSREAMAYLDRLREVHGDRLVVHADDVDGRFNVGELVASIERGTELYMCGPIRLMDAVRRAWLDSPLDPTDLRYETFGNSGWFDPEPFDVEIPSLGFRGTVESDESMLESLERQGVDLMFDCRKGECGLCEVKVTKLRGQLDHRDVFLSTRQHAAADRMNCCVSRAVRATGDDERALITINAN
ncbi:oxidoreductase [Gulosibacter macacae]|uniref:Oxidoreductase n=1 Tax=Gulosibacter macacae TaxID=2488791 RepID=A0A3P3W1M7_9MICO|nr:PDR/VanB family oxidoreductase [Gulosibacter macacae]RRJ88258.1 oxidoreductase [Gulosibacter macacae]